MLVPINAKLVMNGRKLGCGLSALFEQDKPRLICGEANKELVTLLLVLIETLTPSNTQRLCQ